MLSGLPESILFFGGASAPRPPGLISQAVDSKIVRARREQYLRKELILNDLGLVGGGASSKAAEAPQSVWVGANFYRGYITTRLPLCQEPFSRFLSALDLGMRGGVGCGVVASAKLGLTFENSGGNKPRPYKNLREFGRSVLRYGI